MTALALLLIAAGIMLIHAAISGKPIADLIRGVPTLGSDKQPTLNTAG